ncbi:MAG: hypothetical protein AUJ49_10120 [Desulfovibrionaceae bacterium CG1_02_65_16]|nr:MAG: hypothetical protein AUJ49_10120 [Desulfovibrionaceae bacterium CG1_02_65_16]
MLEPKLFSLYLAALAAVYLAPGPDMALVLATSAGRGVRAEMARRWLMGSVFAALAARLAAG